MAAPEVDTKYGRLRGLIKKNINNAEYFAFKGIPYAQPPVGQLRFKDPVPPEPWSGTLDAVEFGSMCTQYDIFTSSMGGSDDCLKLNVYTSSLECKSKQPVMFWIHGGGFQFGSANDQFFGADFFMKKDIVLVTVGYRLGIFGFLNLNHAVATGNQGLKDQVLALTWVQENIESFGGDKNNVTIFGESAGGASVHFLTMSPLAKGLFHKAISQSGVSTNPWTNAVGDQFESTITICELLGKKLTDPEEMVKFLQTVDNLKILDAQEKIRKMKAGWYPYSPNVDEKSPKPFLPISKEIAIREGAHVPYMIGHNDREGCFILQMYKKEISFENDDILSVFLHPFTIDKTLKYYDLTLEDLKHMYCNNGKIFEDTEGLANMIGDILFLRDIHNVIKHQVERNAGPTYMYQFTYDKGYDLSQVLFENTLTGASHMDELLYLFNTTFYELPKKGTPIYKKMEQMIELWTNFAKYGMPTPKTTELIPLYWQPVNDGTVLRHLNIGEELQMNTMINVDEFLSSKIKQKFADKEHLTKKNLVI